MVDSTFSASRGKELEQALEASHTLLAFAVQSRLQVADMVEPKELLDAIAAIETAFERNEQPSVAELTAFWTAYDKLATRMHPITARSILATQAATGSNLMSSWRWPAPWLALIGVLSFALAAYLQAYWVSGTNLLVQGGKAIESQKVTLAARVQPRLDLAAGHARLEIAQARLAKADAAVTAAEAAASATQSAMSPRARSKAEQAARSDSVKTALGRKDSAAEQQAKLEAELQAQKLEVAALEGKYAVPSIELNGHSETIRSNVEALNGWCKRFCNSHWIRLQEADRARLATELTELRRTRDDTRRQQEFMRSVRDCAAPQDRPGSSECALAAQVKAVKTPEANLGARLRELDNAQYVAIAHRVQTAADLLGGYAIPLLMGMLGALVFLLRDIVAAIKNVTYVSRSLAMAVIHISLGAGAGLMGRLLLPAAGNPTLASFSPFVLAFVFGYGVQVLFSLLDKLVTTFSAPTPTPGSASKSEKP